MTIIVDGEVLANAAKAASKAVDSGSTIPMLRCLQLNASDGLLNIMGTDLNIWVEATCEAEGNLAAVCTLAERLTSFAQAAGASRVRMDERQDGLFLRYDSGRAILPLAPADEFPAPRAIEGGGTLAIVPGTLATACAKVLPCLSKERSQHYLCGARLRAGRNDASLTATNGYRLTMTRLPGEFTGRWADAVIPGPALELFGGIAGEVTLRINDGLIQAESAHLKITARLLDGRYPDVERLIPVAAETPLFGCTTAALQAALERVLWTDDMKKLIVGIKLMPGLPGLIWATQSRVKDESTFDCIATRAGAAGFVGRYLLDLCDYAKSERLTFYQSTPTAPGLFVGMPSDVLVIMPCRITPYQTTMEPSND